MQAKIVGIGRYRLEHYYLVYGNISHCLGDIGKFDGICGDPFYREKAGQF